MWQLQERSICRALTWLFIQIQVKLVVPNSPCCSFATKIPPAFLLRIPVYTFIVVLTQWLRNCLQGSKQQIPQKRKIRLPRDRALLFHTLNLLLLVKTRLLQTLANQGRGRGRTGPARKDVIAASPLQHLRKSMLEAWYKRDQV